MIDVVITCYLETVWKDFLAPTESWNSVSHRLSAAGALSHHPVTRSRSPAASGPQIMRSYVPVPLGAR